MKIGLILSLAGNAVLLSALTAVLSREMPDQLVAAPQIDFIAKAPREPAPPKLPPFSWSMVEADSYPAYIANLRRIGCPEQTIRDIISADLTSSNAAAELTYPEQIRFVSTKVTAARVEAQLRLVRSLMGEAEEVELPESKREGSAASKLAAEPTRMPVFLADIPQVSLSAEQKAIVDGLRGEFVSSIGGLNQDPQDPAYLARWQAAQPIFDERLRSMLGWRAYQELQLDSAALQ